MVEIILQRVPESEIETNFDEQAGCARESGQLGTAIFNAIPKDGTTPEEVFNTLSKLFPETTAHEFFLTITSLITGGFIRANIQRVATA